MTIANKPNTLNGTTTWWHTFSPEEAADVLKNKNGRNRCLNEATVRLYADQMAAGNWNANGTTVKFSAEDSLLDGQHRLAACAKSGVPLKTLVVHGLQDDAIVTIDTGRARAFRDLLAIKDVSDPSRVAAAARQLHYIECGLIDLKTQKKVAHSTLLGVLYRWPELPEVCHSMRALRSICPSYSAACAMRALTDRANPAASAEFWESVATGAGLDVGSPVLALRDFFLRVRAGQRHEKVWQVAMVIAKAWNADRSGKKVRLLRATSTEFWPGVKK